MSKRKIIVVILLACSSSAFGQFSKHDLILNGTFLFNSESVPHSSTSYSPSEALNSFGIRSSVGVFLNKNFEIGGLIGYSEANRKEEFPAVFEFKTKLFSTGIYGQRYWTLSRKFFLSVLAPMTFSYGEDKKVSGDGPIPGIIAIVPFKVFQFSTSIRPTVVFFPSPKFGIQAGLGSVRYLYSRKLETDDTQSDFKISYWPVAVGLTYYMARKTE